MKNKILILSSAVGLFLSSCTKKETIVQQYTPPAPTLYGTWKFINSNPSDSSAQYIVLPNDGSNFYYSMSQDEFGFRRIDGSGAFQATDKQLLIGMGGLFNYTVNNDTLKLRQNSGSSINLTRITDPNIVPDKFVTLLGISKGVKTPYGLIGHSYSLGISGDNLYLMASLSGSNKMAKYNVNSGLLTDSIPTAFNGSVYYKSGSIFLGFSNNNRIWKGTEFNAGTYSINSSTDLVNVKALSINGSSNTIYAYQADRKLFAGTDGGSYALLKDFAPMSTDMVVYHNNDAFLILKNDHIYRVKIFPTMSIMNSYRLAENLSTIYAISSNGSDVWATVYNSISGKHEFVKLNIN